VVLPGVQG